MFIIIKMSNSSNSSQNVNKMTQIKKCKVKENWDDESEEESDVEIESSEKTIDENYNKNEPKYGLEGLAASPVAQPLEYEDYEYGIEDEDEDEEEPLDDYDYDYDEIDKKLGNHFRLH